MPIDISDIYFVYSGLGTNENPSLSLGGEPGELITTNALFDNLTAAEGEQGTTDYRCCYLVNDSTESTLNNFFIFAAKDDPTLGDSDVTIQTGFILRNEIQIFTIENYQSVASGTINLTYTHAVFPAKNFTITISSTIDDPTIETIKEAIYTNLMTLEGYAVETNVTHTISGIDLLISIEFAGLSKNKSHTMSVESEEFTVSITKSVEGSPINSVPDEIANEVVTPAGVIFYTSSNPVIGNLEPGDIVPIWIKRKVPKNSRAVTKDGFTLKARGEAILESLP